MFAAYENVYDNATNTLSKKTPVQVFKSCYNSCKTPLKNCISYCNTKKIGDVNCIKSCNEYKDMCVNICSLSNEMWGVKGPYQTCNLENTKSDSCCKKKCNNEMILECDEYCDISKKIADEIPYKSSGKKPTCIKNNTLLYIFIISGIIFATILLEMIL